MRPRNLRSNTPEQKLIQKGFRSFSEPWFYVRKDGEFDALCEGAHAKGFRRSLYQVDESARPVRFRTIDNVAVAKDWYSWIGAAPAVLRGGNDFLGDETLHRRVFSLRPAARHWEYFITDNFKDLDEDLFDAGPASASEYLLASAIAAYIRSSGLSPYRNKREALLRGLEQGALSGNHSIGNVTSSVAEQASFLAGDQRYMFNNYLNNIEDVLVELASFVVMQRAVRDGGGDPDELLVQPGVAEWTSSGFNAPVEDISARHPTGLLATLNASVRNAAEAYCANHADEIAAASRPKMFLGRRETIQEMRTYLT